ncbi:MAG: 4-hydroxy-3-methylbut-2-enyl diphosphate reductase [Candidatus Eremiobacteraeota bacterium]|nr:4-hydroxy-3-methylbut-2-enyl diphosphate reductase [Candidatus Eremiobacteraeota bacterium]
MNITISEGSGFCFGVRRALRLAHETIERAHGAGSLPVYSLGPLVHNRVVSHDLASRGVVQLDRLSEVPRGFLLVRSHGIAPAVREEARAMGFSLVDATCPLVKKIHRIVERLKTEGFPVVVVGHREHPEVEAIMGHCGSRCCVVHADADVAGLPPWRRAGVVVQTTMEHGHFLALVPKLLGKMLECRIHNTICFETERRQHRTGELARHVEAMVVVGGRESSNTAKLVAISRRAGKPAYLVEGPDELRAEWFRGLKEIGITAGASTSREHLEAVAGELLRMGNKEVR